MIGLPRGLTVFMCSEPVDMRKSFDTLSAIVTQQMKRDLLDGDLFLFVGRDRKRAKVLYFDGTGLCLLSKRLEQGQFGAPWRLGNMKALRRARRAGPEVDEKLLLRSERSLPAAQRTKCCWFH